MLDNSGSGDRIIQVFTKVWMLSFVKVGVLKNADTSACPNEQKRIVWGIKNRPASISEPVPISKEDDGDENVI